MSQRKHEKFAERLVGILQRLNQGEPLIIDELLEEYQVDRRTLQRDLNERLSFLPLQRVDKGIYRLDKTLVGKIDLSDVRQFTQFIGVSKLFNKIDQTFFQKYLNDNNIYINNIDYESIKNKQYEFDQILQAIKTKKSLSFRYARLKDAHKSQSQDYIVEPYRLTNKQGVWYLIATHQGIIKTFSLTRLDFLKICHNISFEPDPTIQMKIKLSDNIYFEGMIDKVLLKIHANIAIYFTRRKIFPNQDIVKHLPDGSLILACKNVHKHEILPKIQYWLPNIAVIEPTSLETELIENLTMYLDSLNKKPN